jgi:hypothetical protein
MTTEAQRHREKRRGKAKCEKRTGGKEWSVENKGRGFALSA